MGFIIYDLDHQPRRFGLSGASTFNSTDLSSSLSLISSDGLAVGFFAFVTVLFLLFGVLLSDVLTS